MLWFLSRIILLPSSPQSWVYQCWIWKPTTARNVCFLELPSPNFSCGIHLFLEVATSLCRTAFPWDLYFRRFFRDLTMIGEKNLALMPLQISLNLSYIYHMVSRFHKFAIQSLLRTTGTIQSCYTAPAIPVYWGLKLPSLMAAYHAAEPSILTIDIQYSAETANMEIN